MVGQFHVVAASLSRPMAAQSRLYIKLTHYWNPCLVLEENSSHTLRGIFVPHAT